MIYIYIYIIPILYTYIYMYVYILYTCIIYIHIYVYILYSIYSYIAHTYKTHTNTHTCSAHSTVIITHLLPAVTHLTPHATLSCVQERFALATHEMSESTGFDLKSILFAMCVLALKSNDHSDPKVQKILRNMGWTRLQSAPCASACAETACMNAAWCARLFCPYI